MARKRTSDLCFASFHFALIADFNWSFTLIIWIFISDTGEIVDDSAKDMIRQVYNYWKSCG